MSRFGLWGQLERTRPAILAFALSGAATVGASGRKTLGDARDVRTVDIFVTGSTEGNTIGDIVAHRLVVLPRLDVVGLYLACCAAVLAGVVIAGVDGLSPQAVFIGVASLICVWFTRSNAFAFKRAIFNFEMPIGRRKVFAATVAFQQLAGTVSRSQLAGARGRASGDDFAGAEVALESLAADNTSGVSALYAVSLARIRGLERAVTQGARLVAGCYGRLSAVVRHVTFAGFGLALNLGGTAWMGAKFACCHRCIIARMSDFSQLQRWADATGQTPVLMA